MELTKTLKDPTTLPSALMSLKLSILMPDSATFVKYTTSQMSVLQFPSIKLSVIFPSELDTTIPVLDTDISFSKI